MKSSFQKTRENMFNIRNVVGLVCLWVIDIDGDNFPIGFTFIDQTNDSEYFNLYNLTMFGDSWTDFNDINRIVITFGIGWRIYVARIFPCLWKCTVVPDVTMVWECIWNVTEFTVFGVLLDWIEDFVAWDLKIIISIMNAILFDDLEKYQKIKRPPFWHWSIAEFQRSCYRYYFVFSHAMECRASVKSHSHLEWLQ